jgi:hypothetical protein
MNVLSIQGYAEAKKAFDLHKKVRLAFTYEDGSREFKNIASLASLQGMFKFMHDLYGNEIKIEVVELCAE